jgi:hypothetical protein
LLCLESTGSLYYKPASPDEHVLLIKMEIDAIYTQYPYFRYRRITAWLKKIQRFNYK